MIGPSGKVYWPQRVLLDSGAQPLMLGKTAFVGLGLKPSNVEKCPFPIQTSTGSESHEYLTRVPLVLTLLPGHQTDKSRLTAPTVVTGAESYDVLVSSTILYPMGFTLDYWRERESPFVQVGSLVMDGWVNYQLHSLPALLHGQRMGFPR